jgi:hypothetical protein
MLADYHIVLLHPAADLSAYFTAEERKTLDSSPLESALSEIGLLPVLLLHLT